MSSPQTLTVTHRQFQTQNHLNLTSSRCCLNYFESRRADSYGNFGFHADDYLNAEQKETSKKVDRDTIAYGDTVLLTPAR